MKVYEAVVGACRLLGLDAVEDEINLYNSAVSGGGTYEFSAEASEEIKKLVNCLNLTVERIASNYLRLTKKEALVSDSDGKIEYSMFSHSPIEILDVCEGAYNFSTLFSCLPFHLYVPNGGESYIVKYRYLPARVGELNEDVNIAIFVTPRVLSLGMVSDYLLAKNLYDECKFWNEKFESELLMSINGVGKKTLKSFKFL